jgi:hypothetical protein
MKAKFFIGVLLAILLAGSTAKAQRDDYDYYRNDDSRVVINNYYDDQDYYYSSRINRFHRSYAYFGYYAPVFTETYWYSYQPYTWGISIYGGGGFGAAISYNYPAYGYGYGYGWQPYVSSSYFWGYDPFYYNSWFMPAVYNVRYRSIRSNYYYGWHGRNRWDYGYRPVHNTYNIYNNYNYYSSGKNSAKYTNEGRTSVRNTYPAARDNAGADYSRRGVDYSSSTRTDAGRNSGIRDKSNNGMHTGESRRNTNPAATRGQGNSSNTPANSNMHQGAENSRRAADASGSRSTVNKSTGTGTGTGRIYNPPSRSSASPRREATMSQGRVNSKTESGDAKSGSSSSATKEKSSRRR